MSSKDAPRLELDFPVHSYETGVDGTLSLASLANYLQESADHHARALGVSMERLFEQDLAWVLRRLRIEVGPLPSRGSIVRVATWPTRFDRLIAERHFLGSVSPRSAAQAAPAFLRAASEWVVVDLVTRKVVRLPEFVRELRPDHDERATELSQRRIPPGTRSEKHPPSQATTVGESEAETLAQSVQGQSFVARQSSLDIVGHVNNTQYIEWITDSLPSSLYDTERLCALEIQFLRETRLGEQVVVSHRFETEEGGTSGGRGRVLRHRVEAGEDDPPSVRALAYTEWCPRGD